VQAGPDGDAVRRAALQVTDDLTRGDSVTDRHDGGDWKVGRPQGAVDDRHNSTTGQWAGKAHHAVRCGSHLLANGRRQVHPSVAGAPDHLGRIEAADDLRPWGQGPDRADG
jgi:hypothetical protein